MHQKIDFTENFRHAHTTCIGTFVLPEVLLSLLWFQTQYAVFRKTLYANTSIFMKCKYPDLITSLTPPTSLGHKIIHDGTIPRGLFFWSVAII